MGDDAGPAGVQRRQRRQRERLGVGLGGTDVDQRCADRPKRPRRGHERSRSDGVDRGDGDDRLVEHDRRLRHFTSNTYALAEVSGPGGTIHFVFQGGVAFLQHTGWAHTSFGNSNGQVELELDLCSLPDPAD